MPWKNRLFVTDTGNHRQPLFAFHPWSTVLTLQCAGNIFTGYYYHETQLYINYVNVM